MNPRVALKDGFKHWLVEIAITPSKIPFVKFYPFITSRRSTSVMLPLLLQTEAGQPLAVNDLSQAVGDLRRADLVTAQHPDQTLTELGTAALSLWRELGIANSDSVDEVARWAALIRLGVEQGVPRYVGAFRFWCDLVDLAPAEYWFTDLYTLCMPIYLNQQDSCGYNPFRVLAAVNDGMIGSETEWREWAQTNANDQLGIGLTRLLDRVRESYRYPDCLAFCRGMEAYRLVQTDPDSVPEALRSWGMAE